MRKETHLCLSSATQIPICREIGNLDTGTNFGGVYQHSTLGLQFFLPIAEIFLTRAIALVGLAVKTPLFGG